MSRPLWKLTFSNYELLLRLYENKKSNIFVFSNLKLLPVFLNKTFIIYNGSKYINIKIYEKMINLHLKDFILLKNKLNGKNKKRN